VSPVVENVSHDDSAVVADLHTQNPDPGNQKGRTSWWPPPAIWEESYGSNGWSPLAEAFFQSRLATIEKKFSPISRAEWRNILRPSASLKRARAKVKTHSAEICTGSPEGGLY
jgi:hypothetical protein